ncbi:hypothetical protein, partial [Microbacterium sp. P5_E9]
MAAFVASSGILLLAVPCGGGSADVSGGRACWICCGGGVGDSCSFGIFLNGALMEERGGACCGGNAGESCGFAALLGGELVEGTESSGASLFSCAWA